MKKFLRLLPVFGLSILFLLVRGSVHGDMRPPLPPGGGNLSTEADTWVQLVSETVLLQLQEEMAYDYFTGVDGLQYVVRVTADFNLLNTGSEEESMQAIFPMTSIDPGASYPDPVFDFSVTVNDTPVEWIMIESDQCPYVRNDQTCSWGQFPVTFPPGEMVHVTISYRSYFGEVGGGVGIRYATYILTTGAAWHGPIYDAEIILQLPFEANEETVLAMEYYPEDVHVPEQAPVFDGNQARWQYHSFEPDRNWGIYFPDPDLWVRVEKIRASLAEDEADADLWVELGGIYWDMCTVKEYYDDRLDWLGSGALEAYARAVELAPENAYAHGGYAEVLYGIGYHEMWVLDSIEKMEQSITQYEEALEWGDPEDYEHYGNWNYMLLEVESQLDFYLSEQATQTPSPTVPRLPTVRPTETTVPSSTQTPTEKPPTVVPTVMLTEAPEPTSNLSELGLILTVIGVLLVVMLTVLAVLLLLLVKKKKQ